MAKIKLSYIAKVSLEVDTEEDLQLAIRNLPWLASQPGFTSAQSNVRHVVSEDVLSIADIEESGIRNALAKCPTKVKAAALLGMTRATLNNKIKQYDIK